MTERHTPMNPDVNAGNWAASMDIPYVHYPRAVGYLTGDYRVPKKRFQFMGLEWEWNKYSENYSPTGRRKLHLTVSFYKEKDGKMHADLWWGRCRIRGEDRKDENYAAMLRSLKREVNKLKVLFR